MLNRQLLWSRPTARAITQLSKTLIDNASGGDEVVLQPGNYTGDGNRDISFLGKAITVRSTDPDNWTIVEATIIDCQGNVTDRHRSFYFHDNETDNSTLSGLTIINGYANSGGGVHCDFYSSPTISNCTIIKNQAGYGGGVFCSNNSSPTIGNCTIINNQAVKGGGGVSFFHGGNPILANCSIIGNQASSGSGVYCGGNSSPRISNCTISNNQAGSAGGAVYCWSADSPEITGCTISGNQAYLGGALFCHDSNPEFDNCTISGNRASYDGGGIHCEDNSNITVANCTITGNIAEENGAALAASYSYVLDLPSVVDITNSIFWNGEDQIWNNDNSTITITYSDVQGGWVGLGNIGVDPLFADPGYWDDNDTPGDELDDFWVDGDYHLASTGGRWDPVAGHWVKDGVTSPCVDRGDPADPIGDEPEPNGGRINVGAFGGTVHASKTNACDLDGDGDVDWGDFSIFAANWLWGT